MQDPKDQPAQAPDTNQGQTSGDGSNASKGDNDPNFASEDTGINKNLPDQKPQPNPDSLKSDVIEIEQKEKQIDPGNEHSHD